MKRFILILLAIQLWGCKKNESELDPSEELGTQDFPKVNLGSKTISQVEVYRLPEIKDGNFIKQFEFDRDGVLWVGTFNGGIYRVKDNVATPYNTANSGLGSDIIRDIFIDHTNKVWVATLKGFSQFQNEQWITYDLSNTPLFDNYISEICINKSGDILLGNGRAGSGGLVLKRNGSWQKITPDNSELSSSIIEEIETTDNGDFWVGTGQWQGNGGLFRISEGKIINSYSSKNFNLLHNAVDNIEVIDNNAIWLGYNVPYLNTVGGIQTFNELTKHTSTFIPALTNKISNRVLSMKLSKDGDLWFSATIDNSGVAGLGVINKDGSIDILSSGTSGMASNIFIPYVTEDKNGNIFMAQGNSVYIVEKK